MENKRIKEFKAVLKDLRKLLYDNQYANDMDIHISLDTRSVPSISFEVKDRRVIVE